MSDSIWKEILANPSEASESLKQVKQMALTSQSPAVVSFGTSGWRGELGTEFSIRSVKVVAQAIVKMYQEADAELIEHLGANFTDLQSKGLLLGHDNRMMGPEFAKAIASVFIAEGVKVYYGGEASTPEFSAGIEVLGTAACINITPSHNPADYSGLKFNPIDGGPAGSEITSKITSLSNDLMGDSIDLSFPESPDWEEVKILEAYQTFLKNRGTLNLTKILNFVKQDNFALVCDCVHGSTRGRAEYLLAGISDLTTLRTSDDFLFGGIAPEPSSKNMAGIKKVLAEKSQALKLGVIFDPDGDRIRYFDGKIEIDMNRFGAMAFHFMVVHKKIKGVVAKSVATSNFVNAIAKGLGVKISETPVGFKNFRPLLTQGCSPMALIAFEESDGISGYNNTIEKDAQFGLLLALEMMATTGKSLGEYLQDLQAEYGYFYPERSGFTVDKSLVGQPLSSKVMSIADRVAVGSQVEVGSTSKTVLEIVTVDGVKVIFEDESWLLIRPSGTEPKVRIYAECRIESEKEDMFKAAQALFA